MIVIADTSPLCYLILIEEVELLPQLFGKIHIPKAVAEELGDQDAPIQVKGWIDQKYDWLIIEPNLSVNYNSLSNLHLGEKQGFLNKPSF